MLLLRHDPSSAPSGATAPALEELGEPLPHAPWGDEWLACASCGGFVAHGRARLSVNGAHSHSFINPAGLIFRVACFAEAPGVFALGEESLQFTWFAGFAWRVAVCRACTQHLGWSYRGDGSSFVALIEDRVVERRAPEGPAD